MDLLAELETYAQAASTDVEGIVAKDITKWQKLFNLTASDARDNIEQYRADYSRQRISDELWLDVCTAKEAEGYDREAYEYELFCRPKTKAIQNITTAAVTSTSANRPLRGMILAGPLDTPAKVKEIAGLTTTPAVTTAESENESTSLCYINNDDEQRIRQGLLSRGIDFKPFFIHINIASKDLCSATAAPYLGIDTTLPQHRFNSNDMASLPQQEQFPVTYFFYGTLAEPDILAKVLSLPEPPVLRPACVTGGTVKTWGSKYRAMVDDPGSRVDGHAFVVETKEQERELRVYETNMYEVVRCSISLPDGPSCVQGLTFRFAGKP